MAEREERRFVEIPRESVRLMAESTGLELSDEVAALLAEDVCYRLREATQNSSQFMKHTKRRKLTVEDFNRALRWSSVEAVCGYGSQEVLPMRPAREGELYFPEDREVNLVELALATNIPKGCAETAVRVHVSYLDGKGNLAPQGSGKPEGAGRRCRGRLFQTAFPAPYGPSPASRYVQKLPMIGRTGRPARRWALSDYSLYLPL
ncbi:PREDICTED: TAF6-like RNA polymerase II p300/CBP-associated factor-associated factor 65 kDa subunit 6L [Dipodomys ordii]|uniref:TAF6-like RNA polymerase II p300/CBP-associated factor-associated factor 65 kDa subunit 6L n=1 Tax=Dipodomys ordii TaxID=10020 RepID=A0A1S3GUC7_DIPOR|nr:PREDICTED: TAF6-like RNA polymerase II p300/CBP-associated factor-associated factor 65 kDa subunit 6L [Dipodomys ordii]